MTEPLRIISLGWGVQSFALAAMSALGELPPVNAVIHADTTHERRETYEFAERWTPWLEERGVRVVTVSAQPKITNVVTGVTPPFFTVGPKGNGMLYRTCTDRWKIRPIQKWIRANRDGQQVESHLGITLDEWTRMKPSRVSYITNRFPFMEAFDPPMARYQVARWLQDNGLEIPVKSACIFCPYHNLDGWREIQANGNGDWSRAVVVDALIRHKRPGYECFVHAARIPLDQVDLRNAQDHGQLELWPDEECTGNCFL